MTVDSCPQFTTVSPALQRSALAVTHLPGRSQRCGVCASPAWIPAPGGCSAALTGVVASAGVRAGGGGAPKNLPEAPRGWAGAEPVLTVRQRAGTRPPPISTARPPVWRVPESSLGKRAWRTRTPAWAGCGRSSTCRGRMQPRDNAPRQSLRKWTRDHLPAMEPFNRPGCVRAGRCRHSGAGSCGAAWAPPLRASAAQRSFSGGATRNSWPYAGWSGFGAAESHWRTCALTPARAGFSLAGRTGAPAYRGKCAASLAGRADRCGAGRTLRAGAAVQSARPATRAGPP